MEKQIETEETLENIEIIKQKNFKQKKNPQQILLKEQFSKLIIQMMKKTKKNSPLFKPIKKIKASVQAIGGQDRVSFYQQSNAMAVFHFGLGNQFDKQIILNGTNLREKQKQNKILAKQFVILPGKSFSFLQFVSKDQSKSFIKENQIINLFDEINSEKLKTETVQKASQEKQIIQQKQLESKKTPLFFYKQIHFKNLSRLMVFFYLKSQTTGLNGDGQNSLIDILNCPSKYSQENHIQGLHLMQQFLSKQEQLMLLQWIDSQPWEKLSNRRVQHYGYQFKYGRNQIDKDQIYKHKMPQVFDFSLKKLSKFIGKLSGQQIQYDQLTINDYFAGHGIPAHFDTHSPFEEFFVAISMLSGIVMDWRRYDGTQISTYLKQRSVVVFSGEARYAWLHSIACRKLDNIDNQLKHRSRRLSLTFRKIKKIPCTCKYYFYCDSQGYNQETMKKNNPLLTKYLCHENQQKFKNISNQKIYKQYVLKAYNSFGYDFHNKVIPEIKQYLDLQSSEIVKSNEQNCFLLDIGCGNGQYKKHLNSDKFYYIGIERCQIMIPVEEQMHMDGRKLGFKGQTFDIVLLIAVLHHFTSQNDRIKCLNEARRVLKPKGVLYLTVFNYEGKKNEYPNQDILLDYCLPSHKTLDQNDISKQNSNIQTMVPTFPKNLQCQQGKPTSKGEIFQRYYHLFKIQQISQIVNKSGLKIQQLKTSKENIILKLRKNLQN